MFEAPGVDPREVPTQAFANILLYGPPKSGKSTAALTIPGDVLYLNADTANSLWFGLRNRQVPGDVQQGTLTGVEGLIALAQWAHDPLSALPGTIVLDPIGDIHRQLMEKSSNKAVRPDIRIYGDVAVYLERFCRSLCSAPINLVIVAHDLPVRDETTGEVEYLPATGTSNPSLGRKLMGMVDVLGYTGVLHQQDGTPRYVAQLLDGKGRHGGDRFNVLRGEDGVTADLDLGEWITKITEQDSVAAEPQEEVVAP